VLSEPARTSVKHDTPDVTTITPQPRGCPSACKFLQILYISAIRPQPGSLFLLHPTRRGDRVFSHRIKKLNFRG
jgi:hypothetical protein